MNSWRVESWRVDSFGVLSQMVQKCSLFAAMSRAVRIRVEHLCMGRGSGAVSGPFLEGVVAVSPGDLLHVDVGSPSASFPASVALVLEPAPSSSSSSATPHAFCEGASPLAIPDLYAAASAQEAGRWSLRARIFVREANAWADVVLVQHALCILGGPEGASSPPLLAEPLAELRQLAPYDMRFAVMRSSPHAVPQESGASVGGVLRVKVVVADTIQQHAQISTAEAAVVQAKARRSGRPAAEVRSVARAFLFDPHPSEQPFVAAFGDVLRKTPGTALADWEWDPQGNPAALLRHRSGRKVGPGFDIPPVQHAVRWQGVGCGVPARMHMYGTHLPQRLAIGPDGGIQKSVGRKPFRCTHYRIVVFSEGSAVPVQPFQSAWFRVVVPKAHGGGGASSSSSSSSSSSLQTAAPSPTWSRTTSCSPPAPRPCAARSA
jgi:hypothetical protein